MAVVSVEGDAVGWVVCVRPDSAALSAIVAHVSSSVMPRTLLCVEILAHLVVVCITHRQTDRTQLAQRLAPLGQWTGERVWKQREALILCWYGEGASLSVRVS
jgi:hypothetical protein